MKAAKREKGQDGGKIKGRYRVLMKLLKPFQESQEQHCIEAELIGCCASPWGLLHPSCTVSKINTTSSKVTQTLCLLDSKKKKKNEHIFKGLWVRCQDDPLNQKQVFRRKVWHHPKLLPSVPVQMAGILSCFINGISNRNKWNRISDFKELALWEEREKHTERKNLSKLWKGWLGKSRRK